MTDLIELTAADGVQISLVYATPDNLAGRPVYAPGARAALRPQAADCLRRAAQAARRAGLMLVVYDAYRPAAAQAIFWATMPDPRYVADAALGSNHTRGVAVDVGLLEASGQPLDMGTDFDDMRDQSHHDRDDLSPEVQRNRHLLLGIMLQAGFCSISTEWWHYELPNAQEYALLPESDMVRVYQTH
ncbi:D-alanyl-D-alanine dipeptidase [Castellaniella sp.]|uniref:D-alanyl-D-alanine dipeptidase n=1 Tax=Castellaniella sp. TaxID=1955812 RepID=UPI002AFF1FF7|nr:D-alanyl-D-alanine dipeptidase [Castellaniella sp.]